MLLCDVDAGQGAQHSTACAAIHGIDEAGWPLLAALDRVVWFAYGWPEDPESPSEMDDETILARRLALCDVATSGTIRLKHLRSLNPG